MATMKRTPLTRKTPLRAKKAWLKKQKPLKVKQVLRKLSKSPVAESKRHIQFLLREIVILRDQKCQRCGLPYAPYKDCGVAFQADHLISRGNSATYADPRLCVLLCKPCHGWKSVGSNLRKAEYDAFMRSRLPKERVELWDRCEQESWRPSRKGSYDWKLAEVALEQELRKLKEITCHTT